MRYTVYMVHIHSPLAIAIEIGFVAAFMVLIAWAWHTK